MSTLVALPTLSVEQDVGGASTAFGTMVTTKVIGLSLYMFTSNTGCWITQGTTPVATVGAGSMYVGANQLVYLDGANGAKVAVIQDAVAGKSTLTPMIRV